MEMEDVSGKKMKALDVFSSAIKFLHDHLIDSINGRYENLLKTSSSVQWVLTVPAIWSDAAKSFMRKAAEQVTLFEASFKLISSSIQR